MLFLFSKLYLVKHSVDSSLTPSVINVIIVADKRMQPELEDILLILVSLLDYHSPNTI